MVFSAIFDLTTECQSLGLCAMGGLPTAECDALPVRWSHTTFKLTSIWKIRVNPPFNQTDPPYDPVASRSKWRWRFFSTGDFCNSADIYVSRCQLTNGITHPVGKRTQHCCVYSPNNDSIEWLFCKAHDCKTAGYKGQRYKKIKPRTYVLSLLVGWRMKNHVETLDLLK